MEGSRQRYQDPASGRDQRWEEMHAEFASQTKTANEQAGDQNAGASYGLC